MSSGYELWGWWDSFREEDQAHIRRCIRNVAFFNQDTCEVQSDTSSEVVLGSHSSMPGHWWSGVSVDTRGISSVVADARAAEIDLSPIQGVPPKKLISNMFRLKYSVLSKHVSCEGYVS